jgi:hypothetical protein
LEVSILEVSINAIVPAAMILAISHPVRYRCNVSQDAVSGRDGRSFFLQRLLDHAEQRLAAAPQTQS